MHKNRRQALRSCFIGFRRIVDAEIQREQRLLRLRRFDGQRFWAQQNDEEWYGASQTIRKMPFRYELASLTRPTEPVTSGAV
jgi:hypothetical protein